MQYDLLHSSYYITFVQFLIGLARKLQSNIVKGRRHNQVDAHSRFYFSSLWNQIINHILLKHKISLWYIRSVPFTFAPPRRNNCPSIFCFSRFSDHIILNTIWLAFWDINSHFSIFLHGALVIIYPVTIFIITCILNHGQLLDNEDAFYTKKIFKLKRKYVPWIPWNEKKEKGNTS